MTRVNERETRILRRAAGCLDVSELKHFRGFEIKCNYNKLIIITIIFIYIKSKSAS